MEQREIDLLQSTVERILAAGRTIMLDHHSFQQALAYQKRYDLSPQDSIIYAAIIADLQRAQSHEPKLFVSINWKDFRDVGIQAELQALNCVYMEDYSRANQAIRTC